MGCTSSNTGAGQPPEYGSIQWNLNQAKTCSDSDNDRTVKQMALDDNYKYDKDKDTQIDRLEGKGLCQEVWTFMQQRDPT